MAIDLSGINPAHPVEGVPTTASVRANFAATKTALEQLDEEKAAVGQPASFSRLTVGPEPTIDTAIENRRADFTPPGTGDTEGFTEISVWGAGAPGAYIVQRVEGTIANPEPVPENRRMGVFLARAKQSTGSTNTAAIEFYTTENYGVSGGGRGSEIRLQTTPTGATFRETILSLVNRSIQPGADNTYNFGAASLRAKEIFSASATINTSDAREKTNVRPLSVREKEAAKALIKEIGIYQMLSAVEEKGDAARWHTGMTVQRAIAVMEDYGLDPMRYGFICFDEWPERVETEVMDDGTEKRTVRPAGSRYSFRETRLIMFMLAGLHGD